jgi:ADP-heptose:LPS heptosyltransferase
MNFPGLELTWNTYHASLYALGFIKPWELTECRAAIQTGGKVLVCATTALGDSLLCTPLLKTLSDTLGSQRVGFIVKEPFADLYRDTPWIGQIFTAQGKFRGYTKLKSELRPHNYQIALIANCTEPDFVPQLWWAGVRGFLRYQTRWSRWHEWFANQQMMRHPESPDYATGHAIENNLAMAEALGITPTTRSMLVEIAGYDLDGPSTTPLVLIHPGASRAAKCWPLEKWAAVAKVLHERHGCTFALTGSAAETATCAELARLLPANAKNLAGKFGLRELAKLQKKAALFLSGDTGPYHLAVAVGCPSVTLFAPRDRGSSVEACGPHLAPPEKHAAIQTTCFNAPIDAIPIQPVLDAALRAFGR